MLDLNYIFQTIESKTLLPPFLSEECTRFFFFFSMVAYLVSLLPRESRNVNCKNRKDKKYQCFLFIKY